MTEKNISDKLESYKGRIEQIRGSKPEERLTEEERRKVTELEGKEAAIESEMDDLRKGNVEDAKQSKEIIDKGLKDIKEETDKEKISGE